MKRTSSVEKLIGNTPLVSIARGKTHANLFGKIEYFNPAGSIKDRVAQAMLDDAESQGRLQKGGTVIEATSGNTGIGLAFVAAVRGYRAVIVMPDTMSEERQKCIRAYGAEILLTDGKKGMQGAVEKAEELHATTPNSIIAGQFENPVCAEVHYQTTGVEIWEQTEGKVDVVVCGVGTGGTITGVGRYVKEKNPNVQVIAVEPSSSPLLSQGWAGSHGIQGIGANFIPKVLDRSVYDEVVTVEDADAILTAQTLGKEEGLFVGISSGAAVWAALQIAKRKENMDKNIVVILPDGGGRYLSTALLENKK